MFATTMQYWRRAMSQSAVWSAALWTLVFTSLITGVLVAFGAGAIASAIYHPTLAFTSPPPVTSDPQRVLGAIAIMYLVILAAGPFLMAGIYGLFGQAVAGTRVTWGSFWRFGSRYYGRAWGLLFFALLWGLALSVVAGLLFLVLHTVGLVMAGLVFLLSWPFAIRMMGGLFVDTYSWGDSFRAAFTIQGYGRIWGGGLIALLAYVVLLLVALELIHVLGTVGIIVYFLIVLFMVVAAPIWLFSVYRAAGA